MGLSVLQWQEKAQKREQKLVWRRGVCEAHSGVVQVFLPPEAPGSSLEHDSQVSAFRIPAEVILRLLEVPHLLPASRLLNSGDRAFLAKRPSC